MPTFYDPVADASEAADALRGLAHASRDFPHPEDAYGVIGDLLGGVRSLQQSINQLAARHARHEGRAFDDAGNQAVGIRDAHRAAEQLSRAAATLGHVEDRLNAASQIAGRIAWHPAPPEPLGSGAAGHDPAATAGHDQAGAETPEAEVSRWVNVVFLQGGEADAVLWLINRDGPDAAIDHLRGYDHGQETTDAAMEHGYVHDTPPTGALDKEAVAGEYTMIYNPDLGHVALYRQHPIPPEDRLPAELPAPAPTAPARASAGGPARGPAATGAGAAAARAGKHATARDGGWFAHPGVAAVKRDRGLGL